MVTGPGTQHSDDNLLTKDVIPPLLLPDARRTTLTLSKHEGEGLLWTVQKVVEGGVTGNIVLREGADLVVRVPHSNHLPH